ncbi:MAG: TonB family protein [Thiogranum sp.]|nr:TonB family protein [Thiogranum sp.]
MPQRGLFAMALLVSLAAHGAAAWYWSAHSKSEGAGDQGMVHMPIKIVIAANPALPALPAPPEPQPQAVEPVTPVPDLPQPQRSMKHPQPVVAQAPQPRASKELMVTDTHLETPQVASAGAGAAQSQPAVDYAGLTDSWRSRVMARIEAFKHYPLAARRQRVEGSLEVELNIACDGGVESLNVEGENGVLRNAAERSVKRAAPLPAPPPQLSCPQRLQYAMSYRLH